MRAVEALSQCLLENDPGARAQANRLRRRAVMLSTLCEVTAIGALLLWPLITNGVPPGRFVVTPVPPYAPGAAAQPSRGPARQETVRRHLPQAFAQPPIIPAHAQTAISAAPPSVTDTGGGAAEGAGPAGPLTNIIGATNDHGPEIPPPPPHATRQRGPLNVSGGVMQARLIHRVEPIYPDAARALHFSGMVQLRAIIGSDGSVRQLTVLSGNPILANAAVAAVRQWRYHPTLLDGQPVEVETFITVNFLMGTE